MVTISGPATNALLECWEDDSWQNKDSVPPGRRQKGQITKSSTLFGRFSCLSRY